MSDNDMRIIPERDEIRARSGAAVTKPSSGEAKSTKAARQRAASGESAMIGVLAVMLVLLAGAAAFLYVQIETLTEQRDALAERVLDIESKLSVTDESLSESGAAMQAVLADHAKALDNQMSEIRKLWVVAYDRNRVAIESLQKGQQDGTARLNSLTGSLAKFDPILNSYDGTQSRLETLASQSLVQSAAVDDLAAQSRDLADLAGGLELTMKLHAARLDEYQEAIDAIDQYRIQINQRLLRLEQQPAVPVPLAQPVPAGD